MNIHEFGKENEKTILLIHPIVADVLRHCSRKTLWRTFDSCNNYEVPEPVPQVDTQIHYWYAKGEERERKQDIAYMKRKFPQTKFEVLPELGHAGLVLLKTELFVEMMEKIMNVKNAEILQNTI